MRTRVPLLLALLGMLIAAAPTVQGLARDGKAEAIEEGHLEVEQAQLEASLEGARNAPVLPLPGAECSSGFAGPYPCENVDLLSLVPMIEIGGPLGSDVWGWTDSETGREIVITTTSFGAAFVDVTDPSAPTVLGRLRLAESDYRVLWRDVKVYEDRAYLVSEHRGSGVTVFDLTRLRDFDSDQGFLESDAHYDGFGSAHNIAINEDTGFAYAVGTAGDECEGGLHMLDLKQGEMPVFVGCFAEDGYTHDVQCAIYEGPDTDHQGSEICFAANEDTVTIVDVTDKANPTMLSRWEYDTAGYTHQGWLTPDHEWFIFGDELDEDGPLTRSDDPVPSTATYIINVSDLDQAGEVKTYLHDTEAIDHNMYITDDGTVWQANYTAGLRVLRYTEEGLADGELEPVGFFDVAPGPDAFVFAGAWTAYPFFESGTIALNSFDSGLFLLKANLPEVEDPDDGEGNGNNGDNGCENRNGGEGNGNGNGNGHGDNGCENRNGGNGNGNGGGDDEGAAQVLAASATLPTTGGGALTMALGLLLVGGAVALRRSS